MRRYLARFVFVVAATVMHGRCGGNERQIENGALRPATLHVGHRETVVSKQGRDAAGLNSWPDGTLGVLKSRAGYLFFGANRGMISRTVGTLDNPLAVSVRPDIPIQKMKHAYQYAAGGPVYRDPATHTLLLFYHAERWLVSDQRRFYSILGMAKSTDDGNTWIDLGEILTPNVAYGAVPHAVEVGGAPFLIIGDYFYVYFRDYLNSGETNQLAVARAPVAEVVQAANQSNEVVSWTKYYNHAWGEPGLGGRSSPLERDNPGTRWFALSYNAYLKRYIMVVSATEPSGTSKKVPEKHEQPPENPAASQHVQAPGKNTRTGTYLYYTDSSDGIYWSGRRPIEEEPGESFYPTIVGKGDEPRDTATQFYVYYTYSRVGEFGRWDDAILARRTISL